MRRRPPAGRARGAAPVGLIALVSLTLLAATAACQRRPAIPSHLLLVVFDTLRADRMSVYGHALETTPHLAETAGEFLRFADVKAPAPWTVPAHASLLTGLWPAEHRAQWGSMRLADRLETLAKILRADGFCTLGLSANPLVGPRTRLDQGFDDFEVIPGSWWQKTAAILEQLPARLAQAESDRCRLFVFLNLMDAHIPYNTSRYGKQFGARGAGPVGKATLKWQISAGERPFSEREKREHAAAYDAAVRYLDDVVRELLAHYRAAGLLDDTLVVLTSDHGDGLGAHPELGHSISVWEEQLRVPLLVRFPDGRRGGEVAPGRTTLTAVTPSLLDWLGVRRPPALRHSPDLDEASREPVTADYRSYFAETNRAMNAKMAELYPELASRVQHAHVLYCDRYKLVVEASGRRRLFDLAADPEERHELRLEEGSPPFAPCWQEYRRLLARGRFTPFAAGPPADSAASEDDDLEALRSLGYVQ